MSVEPHVGGCPGCVADQLASEDREYLASTGWEHPRHVLAPKPRLAPPAPPRSGITESGEATILVVGGLVWAGVLFAAPVPMSMVSFAAAACVLTWWWFHKETHQPAEDGCAWCRRAKRQAAKTEWMRYQSLAFEDQRRTREEAQAAHYKQLRRQ